ncbi:MAG: helicase HerA-like domain-containing protein [Pseudomonadales bacterium]
MQKNTITLGYVQSGGDEKPGVTPVELDLKRANRHGLIAGATGTGKTVTLQGIAESLSNQGVPVFLCDIKGDVSGISQAGKPHPKINERLELLGLPTDAWQGCPTMFWDVYGEKGQPIRATVSDMGPLLLSRLLNLNETQEGILNIAFAVADDQGLLLLDMKDLRAMVQHVGDSAAELRTLYGNVSTSSIGAIQRHLLVLERSGANIFFGEPMLDLGDFMRRDREGRGYINVLAANRLYQEPAVYSTVLLWLLSELFENLPEIGDPEKPVLALFFDEAHLMFKDAPKALVEKVEQVVRLIRSKGVGVYFITQSPSDVPDSVLAQLGNRVQHALRAFTPNEQKAVKTAADTFRANPAFSTREAITELGVGEALVSTLQSKGVPTMVQRTFIKPPVSRIGPASKQERDAVMQQSPCRGIYDEPVDRESAFEKLQARAAKAAAEAEEAQQSEARTLEKPKTLARGRQRQGIAEAFAKSMVRSLGSRAGRSLARGILGSLFKGK